MANQPSKSWYHWFTGGGWVLVASGMLTLILLTWAVAPAILRSANRPPGDGKNISTYGFDLSTLIVPREHIAPAMLHRDMAPAMTSPSASGPDAAAPSGQDDLATWKTMQRRNDPKYGKYLVPSDRVIGVHINGEARAYPLQVMYVHEIINDTLGGVPIAVTYNWPCDSTVVFDRRVNGQALEFSVSGLVYNSNLLMYDRPFHSSSTSKHDVSQASLWSQLLGKAVSGPAAIANATLDVLSVTVMSWGQWSALHPQTMVLDRDLSMTARYKDAAPTAYFNSDRLLFPISVMPPQDQLSIKEPMLIVRIGNERRVYRVSALLQRMVQPNSDSTPSTTEYTDTIDGVTVRFKADANTRSIWVIAAALNENAQSASSASSIDVIYSFWFAWHAMYPDDEPAISLQ